MDTGALRGSIGLTPARIEGGLVTGVVTAGGDEYGTAEVGSKDIDYAIFQELAEKSGKPYMRPALNMNKGQIIKNIRKAMKEQGLFR